MHVLVSVIILFFVIKKGVWKKWEVYHTTILFIIAGNLLYNFLTASYFLWRLEADFLSNHTTTELLYTFIVFPSTVLLYLEKYPSKNQFLYTLKWIAIYVVGEIIVLVFGRIKYQYGWNLGYSILFDFIMFPTLRLHTKKPLLAYLISAIVAITVIWWFDVPVHLPVEKR